MDTSNTTVQPLIVHAEKAEAFSVFGIELRVLLSAKDTGGAVSALIATHKPGEGPPDHFHRSQEEFIFILEGTYSVTIDGRSDTVGPGAMLFIPRGAVHSFKNVGDTVGRMLDCANGGQDAYFREVSQSVKSAGFVDMAEIKKISLRHDTEFPAPQH